MHTHDYPVYVWLTESDEPAEDANEHDYNRYRSAYNAFYRKDFSATMALTVKCDVEKTGW